MFFKKKVAAALVFVMVLMAAMPAFALQADSRHVYEGIDVSVYQGNIDFEKVKGDGIEVVYIRAGEGSSYVDSKFKQNARRAKAAGLKFGFYLYVTAQNTEEAEQQASFFADLIKDYDYDCRPAMDFENFSGLSRDQVNQIGKAFMEKLEEETGLRPVIYTNANAANRTWSETFGKYPLWAAEYGPSEPEITSGIWESWAGFQYTSSGRVEGIEGRVDKNRFTDTMFVSDNEEPPGPVDPGSDDKYIKYTVKRGDTLWKIAKRYGTTVNAIVKANGIQNPDLIRVGEILKIPKEKEPSYIKYTVRKGDTLWDIAKRYGTSVGAIVKINAIKDPDLIYVGEVFKILANGEKPSQTKYIKYRVKRGDTLWSIAIRYGTTVKTLERLNHLADPDFILVGQILKVPR